MSEERSLFKCSKRFTDLLLLLHIQKQRKGQSLFKRNVLIIGGGGTTLSYIALLQPFQCRIKVLRRSSKPLDLSEVSPSSQPFVSTSAYSKTLLHSELSKADIVMIAAASTPQTVGMFSKEEFSRMKKSSILINVARGNLVVTQDLHQALQDGTIDGAGIDVTDPEPLPQDHSLWKVGKEINLIVSIQ